MNRNIKTNITPIQKKFRAEGKFALKIKEIMREIVNKNLFYATHSKFATYADPDYLYFFKDELLNSKEFIRLQGKDMNGEKDPYEETHSNSRELHVLDVSMRAKYVARKTLLNEEMAEIGGILHDIGHTCYAHDGEYNISKYLEEHGICYIHHCALARLVVLNSQLHQKVMKRLEEERARQGKKMTPRYIKHCEKTFNDLLDIAVCHDGEDNKREEKTNRKKSEQDVRKEFIENFTVKGKHKKTISRTPEGLIVLLCDVISYTPKDYRDGIIRRVIDIDDEDYEALFEDFGIPKETLREWSSQPSKKDKIVSAITDILARDLADNSYGIDGVRMSEKVASLMYRFRKLNFEKVVPTSTRKISNIRPERKKKLLEIYANKLVDFENGREVNMNKYQSKMVRTINQKQPPVVQKLYKDIVNEGIRNFIEEEVEEVISTANGNEPNLQAATTLRRERIEKDIKKILDSAANSSGITEDLKQAYIERILNEINLSPEKSHQLLRTRMKVEHPDAIDDELDKLCVENSHLRLETFDECIAKLKTAIYIGEGTNNYLIQLLDSEGLLSEEEKRTRYQLGGEITGSLTRSIEEHNAKGR